MDDRSFVGAFAEITTLSKSRSPAHASDQTSPPPRRRRSSTSATTIHKTSSSSSTSSTKAKASPPPPPPSALQACKIASLGTGGNESGEAGYNKLAGHTCETIDEDEGDDHDDHDDHGGRRPLLKENQVPRVVHFENAPISHPPRRSTTVAPQEQRRGDPKRKRRLLRLFCL